MRSILHQLKKYRPLQPAPPQQINIDQPTISMLTTNGLAERIVQGPLFDHQWAVVKNQRDIRAKIAEVKECLKDMPIAKHAGTLYPLEVLGAFHCFYGHSFYACTEETTDWFLQRFLTSLDIKKYVEDFSKVVDDKTKRIVIARMAMATFDSGTKKEDKLDREPYRAIAGKFLGLISITPVTVMDTLESLHATASIEHILLGRVGYIMLWNWLQIYGRDESIPLLESVPYQIPRS